MRAHSSRSIQPATSASFIYFYTTLLLLLLLARFFLFIIIYRFDCWILLGLLRRKAVYGRIIDVQSKQSHQTATTSSASTTCNDSRFREQRLRTLLISFGYISFIVSTYYYYWLLHTSGTAHNNRAASYQLDRIVIFKKLWNRVRLEEEKEEEWSKKFSLLNFNYFLFFFFDFFWLLLWLLLFSFLFIDTRETEKKYIFESK